MQPGPLAVSFFFLILRNQKIPKHLAALHDNENCTCNICLHMNLLTEVLKKLSLTLQIKDLFFLTSIIDHLCSSQLTSSVLKWMDKSIQVLRCLPKITILLPCKCLNNRGENRWIIKSYRKSHFLLSLILPPMASWRFEINSF